MVAFGERGLTELGGARGGKSPFGGVLLLPSKETQTKAPKMAKLRWMNEWMDEQTNQRYTSDGVKY